jgi:2-amino-4-hydroxy-6-hydroxymethyldihydropteridine diphosphokinase
VAEPVTAYIGLGANLDNPADHVRRALQDLAAIARTRVVARSPLYRSGPLGPQDQPDYINAVARLETGLTAQALFQELLAVERRHGRERDGRRWGPRPLDLDLLLYGDLRLDHAELTVPHPGLHERAFVLYPLADIAPELRIPGLGGVRELRDRCTGPKPERLEPDENE